MFLRIGTLKMKFEKCLQNMATSQTLLPSPTPILRWTSGQDDGTSFLMFRKKQTLSCILLLCLWGAMSLSSGKVVLQYAQYALPRGTTHKDVVPTIDARHTKN